MADQIVTRLPNMFDTVRTDDLPNYVWQADDHEYQEGVRPDGMIMMEIILGTLGVHDSQDKFVCKRSPTSEAVRLMLHQSMFVGNTRLSNAGASITGKAAHQLALTALNGFATTTLAKLNDPHNEAFTRESLLTDTTSLHVVMRHFLISIVCRVVLLNLKFPSLFLCPRILQLDPTGPLGFKKTSSAVLVNSEGAEVRVYHQDNPREPYTVTLLLSSMLGKSPAVLTTPTIAAKTRVSKPLCRSLPRPHRPLFSHFLIGRAGCVNTTKSLTVANSLLPSHLLHNDC
jgi:hypothetical protein